MPEHLHLLIAPRYAFTISQVMQSIKGYSSRRINEITAARGRLWQQSFYDRIIRDEEQLNTIVAYIEENPVMAGLVSNAPDYQWSSAHPGAQTDLKAWLSG